MYGIALILCRYCWRSTTYKRSQLITFFLTALVYIIATAELLARNQPEANRYLSVVLVGFSFLNFACLILSTHLVPLTLSSCQSTNLINMTLIGDWSIWAGQLIASLVMVIGQILIFSPLFVVQFQNASWLVGLNLGLIFISGSLWLQIVAVVTAQQFHRRVFPGRSPKLFILGIIIAVMVFPAMSPVSWSRLLSPVYVLVKALVNSSTEKGLSLSAIGLYVGGYFLFSLVHLLLKEVS